jgi:hypothetical protein
MLYECPVVRAPTLIGRDTRTPTGSKRSLAVSIALHLILVFFATSWVIYKMTPTQSKAPNAFATGGGGGNNGERAIARKANAKPIVPKNLTKSSQKITSKSATAQIALPELPDLKTEGLRTMARSSKGFGGGAGGGIGNGIGAGNGGKNFVGRPVLGMKITGESIAVYMDNSGSMTAYLDEVEKLIVKQFPKADVFRYPGIGTFLMNGEFRSFANSTARESSPSGKLSPQGRKMMEILRGKAYGPNVGGWVDTMLKYGHYDSLVIFSDFADPIIQNRSDVSGFTYRVMSMPTAVPNASKSAPPVANVLTDTRNDAEKAWEKRWLDKFSTAADGEAPRLYLMSVKYPPHQIYLDCMGVSGGEYSIVEVPNVKLKGRK